MTIMSSNHQYESMMILRNHWEYGEILLPSPRWSPRCNEHGPSYAGNGARLLPALEAAIPGSLSPHWEWIHMNPDFFGRDESWWNPLNLHLRAILVWAKKTVYLFLTQLYVCFLFQTKRVFCLMDVQNWGPVTREVTTASVLSIVDFNHFLYPSRNNQRGCKVFHHSQIISGFMYHHISNIFQYHIISSNCFFQVWFLVSTTRFSGATASLRPLTKEELAQETVALASRGQRLSAKSIEWLVLCRWMVDISIIPYIS